MGHLGKLCGLNLFSCSLFALDRRKPSPQWWQDWAFRQPTRFILLAYVSFPSSLPLFLSVALVGPLGPSSVYERFGRRWCRFLQHSYFPSSWTNSGARSRRRNMTGRNRQDGLREGVGETRKPRAKNCRPAVHCRGCCEASTAEKLNKKRSRPPTF